MLRKKTTSASEKNYGVRRPILPAAVAVRPSASLGSTSNNKHRTDALCSKDDCAVGAILPR